MTQSDYIAGLELLKAKRPNYPLIRTLEDGYNSLNCIYMKHALREIPNATKVQKKRKKAKKTDGKMKRLQIEKKGLFGRRAKLSNSFDDCKTDADRANVSDEIKSIQKQIKTVSRSILYYDQNGKLPEKKEAAELNLSGIELIKKRNSLRSNISIRKSSIIKLQKEGPNKNKSRIQELSDKLKELNQNLQNVQILIDKESI